MRIDRSKLKKCASEVPAECATLIEEITNCNDEELLLKLKNFKTWSYGKCELYHWCNILDRFDSILEKAANKHDPDGTNCKTWVMHIDVQAKDSQLEDLVISVLHFTTLIVEHSFSRHLYSSVDRLIALMACSRVGVVLAVLNLLYMFSKRSNFITRLSPPLKSSLVELMTLLGQCWGGRDVGLDLPSCCSGETLRSQTTSSRSLFFEAYPPGTQEKERNVTQLQVVQVNNVTSLGVDRTPSQIMDDIVRMYDIPQDKQMEVFIHLRLICNFSSYDTLLQCVQSKLQALSVLVYCNALTDNASSILYPGILDEFVGVLKIQNPELAEIKAATLRTLTSIIHLERMPNFPKLSTIIDVTGAGTYHGFAPTMVRACITSLVTGKETDPPLFPVPLATSLFSFLYHLASYESGAEALLSCGIMDSLIKVIMWQTTKPDHITFVTRAVRVIDLITNLAMPAFQAMGGVNSFIERLDMEVTECRKEQPYMIPERPPTPEVGSPRPMDTDAAPAEPPPSADSAPASVSPPDASRLHIGSDDDVEIPSTSSLETRLNSIDTADRLSGAEMEIESGSSDALGGGFSYEVEASGLPKFTETCLSQRAALLKSMLNFLKKCLNDHNSHENTGPRNLFEGTLCTSLKHILSNAEYYGASLFILATDMISNYVYGEPSLLSPLQDSGLTRVLLYGLLVKNVPATREVLSSLPAIFSSLCMNTRGLQDFVQYKPFDHLFKVLLSPDYLAAFRRRRPTGDGQNPDTATALGSAMDELMRHQPSLRTAATAGIVGILKQLSVMGSDQSYVCWKMQPAKQDAAQTPSGSSQAEGEVNDINEHSSDEDDYEDDEPCIVANTKRGSATIPPAATTKTPVPLVDYILNIMKFVDAILSNNSTDDHCKEFVSQGGLEPLMDILGLPNLPLDFPSTGSLSSIAVVCKSILNLAAERKVIQCGIQRLDSHLASLDTFLGSATVNSGLLQEVLVAVEKSGADTLGTISDPLLHATATPTLHRLKAIHSHVSVIVYVCRTSQPEVRNMAAEVWGAPEGVSTLETLGKLYQALVWEATVLINVNAQHEKRVAEAAKTKPCAQDNSQEDLKESSASDSVKKTTAQSPVVVKKTLTDETTAKLTKTVLNATSKLGKALSELFTLLTKLSAGSPLRQRRGHGPLQQTPLLSSHMRILATSLSCVMRSTLQWRLDKVATDAPVTTDQQLRLAPNTLAKLEFTFMICSLKFASPMLFDEKKLPFHQMLGYFCSTGGFDAYQANFDKALLAAEQHFTADNKPQEDDMSDSLVEYLENWCALLEKLVHCKNLFESPHTVIRQGTLPQANEFVPINFFVHVQKAAFKSIIQLWDSTNMHSLSIAEQVLSILSSVLKSEAVIKKKYARDLTQPPAVAVSSEEPWLRAMHLLPSTAATAAASEAAVAELVEAPSMVEMPQAVSAELPEDALVDERLEQLAAMGFVRSRIQLALQQTDTMEQATEFLLTTPVSPIVDESMSEDPEMMAAIALSLQANNQPAGETSGERLAVDAGVVGGSSGLQEEVNIPADGVAMSEGTSVMSEEPVAAMSNETVVMSEEPVAAMLEEPVAPTSEAPVAATSQAPVAATSQAPVAALSEAPVAASSEAPVAASSEAPVAAMSVDAEAAMSVDAEAAMSVDAEAAMSVDAEAAVSTPNEDNVAALATAASSSANTTTVQTAPLPMDHIALRNDENVHIALRQAIVSSGELHVANANLHSLLDDNVAGEVPQAIELLSPSFDFLSESANFMSSPTTTEPLANVEKVIALDPEPLSREVLDLFTDNVLSGCLRHLDHQGELVYKACELLSAVGRRNGPEWQLGNIRSLAAQTSQLAAALRRHNTVERMTGINLRDVSSILSKAGSSLCKDKLESEQITSKSESFKKFGIRLHLMTLLMEDMRENVDVDMGCESLVKDITELLRETELTMSSSVTAEAPAASKDGASTLQDSKSESMESEKGSDTPTWIAPAFLFIDLFDKIFSSSSERVRLLKSSRRIWKCFDVSSNKWAAYPTPSNKLIDDAFCAGESSARITSSRRRYIINFNSMYQVNEETNNRRPVMVVVEDVPKMLDSKEDVVTADQEPSPSSGLNVLSSVIEDMTEAKEGEQSAETPMDTEEASNTPNNEPESMDVDEPIKSVVKQMPAHIANALVSVCVGLLKKRLDGNTLHAVMRLSLRLTTDWERAAHFARLGGIKAILAVDKNLAYKGFFDLASLIMRHVLEEPKTLRHVMRQVVRSCVTTQGPKETRYILRQLAPAASRNREVFLSVAKEMLKTELEKKQSNASNSPPGEVCFGLIDNQPKPHESYTPSAECEELIRDLLDSLAACSNSDLSPVSDPDIALQTDSDTPAAMRRLNLARSNSVTEMQSIEDTSPVDATAAIIASDFSMTAKPIVKVHAPILSRSNICKLLSEFVKCYPELAKLVVNHMFSIKTSEDCSKDMTALSYMLDTLICGEAAVAEECSGYVRVLIGALAACNQCPEVQTALVSEVKTALSRACQMSESPKKHECLQALIFLICTMMETCPMEPQPYGKPGSCMNNMMRSLIRKGVVTDLARLTHCLDLSSPRLAATINGALKALEMVARVTNTMSTVPNVARRKSANAAATSSTSQAAGTALQATTSSTTLLTAADAVANTSTPIAGQSGSSTSAPVSANPATASAGNTLVARPEDNFEDEEILDETVREVPRTAQQSTDIGRLLRIIDQGSRSEGNLQENMVAGGESAGEDSDEVASSRRDPAGSSTTHVVIAYNVEDDDEDDESMMEDTMHDSRMVTHSESRFMDDDDIEDDDANAEDDAASNDSSDSSSTDDEDNDGPDNDDDGDNHSSAHDDDDVVVAAENVRDDEGMDEDGEEEEEEDDEDDDDDDDDREVNDREESMLYDIQDSLGNGLLRNLDRGDDQNYVVLPPFPGYLDPFETLDSIIFPHRLPQQPTTGWDAIPISFSGVTAAAGGGPGMGMTGGIPAHPLLQNPRDNAEVGVSATVLNASGGPQRARGSRTRTGAIRYEAQGSRATATSTILHRLLGTTRADAFDLPDLRDATQLLFSTNASLRLQHTDVDTLFNHHHSTLSAANNLLGLSGGRSSNSANADSNQLIQNLPSSMPRWLEESRILHADAIHDTLMQHWQPLMDVCEKARKEREAEQKRQADAAAALKAAKAAELAVAAASSAAASGTDAEKTVAETKDTSSTAAGSALQTGAPAVVAMPHQDSPIQILLNTGMQMPRSSAQENIPSFVVVRRTNPASDAAPGGANIMEASLALPSTIAQDPLPGQIPQEAPSAGSSGTNLLVSGFDVSTETFNSAAAEETATASSSPAAVLTVTSAEPAMTGVGACDAAVTSGSSSPVVCIVPPAVVASNYVSSDMMEVDSDSHNIVLRRNQPAAPSAGPAVVVDTADSNTTDTASSELFVFSAPAAEGSQLLSSTAETSRAESSETAASMQTAGAPTEVSAANPPAEASGSSGSSSAATFVHSRDTAFHEILGDMQIPEGVDPGFLAALPPDMRNDVIQEHLRAERITAPPPPTATGAMETVDEDFLAALPEGIREEVLTQQRMAQASLNRPDQEPVDPTSFLENLPLTLRTTILADMDASQFAALAPEVAQEAQSLRRQRDERAQRENAISGRQSMAQIMRGRQQAGGRAWAHWNVASQAPQVMGARPSKGRQLLDHEALGCLLVLLFLDESRLNTSRLHRLLRYLCSHGPTRQWVLRTLLSMMKKCPAETIVEEVVEDAFVSALSSAHQSTPEAVKPRNKVLRPLPPMLQSTVRTEQTQSSWLNMTIDASLGCRTNVLKVQRPTQMGKKSVAANTHIGVHPHASPLVCKHALDALISLAKVFSQEFTPHKKKATDGVSTSEEKAVKKVSDSGTDFWDVLIKLDNLNVNKKGKGLARSHSSASASISHEEPQEVPLEQSPLGLLLAHLEHPVVRRSTTLTDKLLRLIATISSGLYPKSSATTVEPVQTPETKASLERLYGLVVSVLTEKSCSEEGIEDATQILGNLARGGAMAAVLKLAVLGAGRLGADVARQAEDLRAGLGDVGVAVAPVVARGVLVDRYTQEEVVVSGPAKPKGVSGASELQLPALGVLTCKASSQTFFLRTLKLVILMRELMSKATARQAASVATASTRDGAVESGAAGGASSDSGTASGSAVAIAGPVDGGAANSSTVLTSRDSISAQTEAAIAGGATVAAEAAGHAPLASGSAETAGGITLVNPASERVPELQEAMETGEVMQMRDGDTALLTGLVVKQTSTATPDAALSPLSEELQLPELWSVLSACLDALANSSDSHAVLVLQPTVEAFFLVHAGTQSSRDRRRNHGTTQAESRENQLAHLDHAPLSPLPPSQEEDLDASLLRSSSGALTNCEKFLKFAKRHRSVLNQILRQSSTHLSDGTFSVLVDHIKLLDFDVKRRYFRYELDKLDEGVRRDDLTCNCRRDTVFEDSYRELHRRSPEEWKSRMYIVFQDEEGQDAGGLLREWYMIISREIFNPNYALFCTCPGDRVTYMINCSSHCNSNHLSYFKFVGRVIAKAIFDNKLLDCYFTRSFYKHILGIGVGFSDMESEDYTFYKGLEFLMNNHVSELGYEQNFATEMSEFGVVEMRELKPGGENIIVTEENKPEYVKLVCQMKMTGAIRTQLKSFLEGFYEIIPKRLISIFNEQELELLISGLPDLDIDELRANTEYHKYTEKSLQIQWFWRALRSLSQAQRAKFIQFVTGTSKVPLQGFAALEGMNGPQKFQIHRDERSTSRLPSAHTCFNQLDLPAYETYDKLLSYLVKAVDECSEGFGFA